MKKLIVTLLLVVPLCLFAQEKSPSPKILGSELLFVLDGKILPSLVRDPKDSTRMVKPMDLIDPKTIEKINVIKGLSATQKYGDAGKNGVIEIISMKKPNQGN